MQFLRILVAADFHGDAKAFERVASKAEEKQANLIVLCGDITHFGSVEKAKELMLPITRLQLPIFFVPGNCDPPSLAEVKIDGAHCVHGACKTYGELVFIGVGGCPISPFFTPFEMREDEIMDVLNKGFRQCPSAHKLILVSHSPPKNTKVDLAHSGGHVGSVSVRRFIDEKMLSIVFCAHIHEARGTDKIGKTVVVNPGPARHGQCAIANLNQGFEVKLDTLR